MPEWLLRIAGELAIPDPMDITKFQWRTILAFMGASEEEIRDVQLRMGRVWR